MTDPLSSKHNLQQRVMSFVSTISNGAMAPGTQHAAYLLTREMLDANWNQPTTPVETQPVASNERVEFDTWCRDVATDVYESVREAMWQAWKARGRRPVETSGPSIQGLKSIGYRPRLPLVDLVMTFESIETAQAARKRITALVIPPEEPTPELTVDATPSTGQGNTSWGVPVKPSPALCPNGHPAKPIDLDVHKCDTCGWIGYVNGSPVISEDKHGR